jgi:hypothetical protein
MSGFGVPVKVETLTDINQALINIQRTLSDLFSSLVSVTVTGPAGPAGPPGTGAPGPAGPPGPGGLWFAPQVNSTASRLLNTAGVLDVVSVLGVGTNSNAAAGTVGEFISATVLVGAAVPLSSGVPANVASISLTAGDWDVGGNVVFDAAASTTITTESGGISLTSVTMPTPPATGAYFSLSTAFVTGGDNAFPVGTTRLSVASTTLVFLVVNATFAVSTLSAYGFIGARRRR